MDKWTPAEKAIYDAIQEVEKMGCDVKLTEAVTKLSEVQNCIADYVDAHSGELSKGDLNIAHSVRLRNG